MHFNVELAEAVTQLLELSDFSVDLVPMAFTKPRMTKIVDQQGLEL